MQVTEIQIGWKKLLAILNRLRDGINKNEPLQGDGISLSATEHGIIIATVDKPTDDSSGSSAADSGAANAMQGQISDLQNQVSDLQVQLGAMQDQLDALSGAGPGGPSGQFQPGGIINSGNSSIDTSGIPVPDGATGFISQMRYLNPAGTDGQIQVNFNPYAYQDNIVQPGPGQTGYMVAWYFGANGAQLGDRYQSNQVTGVSTPPGETAPKVSYYF